MVGAKMIVPKPDSPVRGETIRILEVRSVGDSDKDRLRVRLDSGREIFLDSSTGFSVGELGVAMYQGEEFIGALNLNTGQYSYEPYKLQPLAALLFWLMIVPGGFLTFGITAVLGILLFMSAGRLSAKRSQHVGVFVAQFAKR